MSKKDVNDRDFSIDRKVKKKKSFFAALLSSAALFFIVAGAIAAVLLTLFLKNITETLPTYQDILEHEPSLATVVYDRNGKVVTQLFKENRTWVKLDDISPWMIKAVLAAEDDSFYEHSGIRPIAIVRALIVDVFHRGAKQGASTITQQLARNLFLSNEKTVIRKAKEAVLALRLEKVYTKDQLLEMYLNTIYMGHGAYGVESAAKTYFNKKPKNLTADEAALLAGLVAAPEKYSPLRNKSAAQARKAYVLRRMLDLDWMSKDDYDANINKETKLAEHKSRKNSFAIDNAPYFVSHILFNELLPMYGTEKVYRGGLKVNTTIDLDLQKKAEEVVSKMPHEGALVALDPNTGEILALVGGRNFDNSKFNRATQAFRQPGSSFKPFVYAAAIEQGYRGVDHILDAPLHFANGWSPGNYTSNKFDGEVTLVTALARSINTPAVRLAQIDGVGQVADLARRVGITTPYLPDDLSMSLGTASVTPLEMAVAYSAFANNGYRVEPFAIKEVISQRGEALKQNGPQLNEAISPATAVAIRSMLEQVTSWGIGARAKIPNYQTFGKTGTTNGWTDAWFAGGIPGLVVVVYVGNDDHKPLGGRSTGAVAALPVWKEFVDYAVTKLNLPQRFSVPADAEVEAVNVCRKTGFIATSGCESAALLLPLGHAPSSACPWHGGSLAAAQADENAPLLLLAPIDGESETAEYRLNSIEENRDEGEGSPSEGGLSVAQKQTEEQQPTKLPGLNNKNPYKKDPSQQSDMEARYQELLRKYKIIE